MHLTMLKKDRIWICQDFLWNLSRNEFWNRSIALKALVLTIPFWGIQSILGFYVSANSRLLIRLTRTGSNVCIPWQPFSIKDFSAVAYLFKMDRFRPKRTPDLSSIIRHVASQKLIYPGTSLEWECALSGSASVVCFQYPQNAEDLF